MKQLSLAIFCALSLIFSGCEKVTGDGPVVTENRITGNFTGLDVRVDADVQVKQDAAYKVEVSAQRNVLDVLETYISNNRLVIKFKNNVNVRRYSQVKITVTAPLINSLRLNGSGNVAANGTFSPSNMELAVSGSGNLRVQQLNTAWLDASVSGSGSIFVEGGTASEENLRISGSGNIELQNVVADRAATHTSGSGNIKLHALQRLDVTISGSGNVYYKGSPVINTTISGSGSVVHF